MRALWGKALRIVIWVDFCTLNDQPSMFSMLLKILVSLNKYIYCYCFYSLKIIIIFKKDIFFPIVFFSFNEAESIYLLHSDYRAEAQNLNDYFWLNVLEWVNILLKRQIGLSKVLQQTFHLCSSCTQVFPKVPKRQDEEKRKKKKKKKKRELLKCAMFNIWDFSLLQGLNYSI